MRALVMGVAVAAFMLYGQSDPGQPPDEVVQLALNAAATQLGLTVDDVLVTTATEAEWPDSSLGCPQPGMAYAQIVTPGWLVTVATADATAEMQVHTDGGSRAVLC
jgi:hypothetical protein